LTNTVLEDLKDRLAQKQGMIAHHRRGLLESEAACIKLMSMIDEQERLVSEGAAFRMQQSLENIVVKRCPVINLPAHEERAGPTSDETESDPYDYEDEEMSLQQDEVSELPVLQHLDQPVSGMHLEVGSEDAPAVSDES